jgi:hypothetical protein
MDILETIQERMMIRGASNATFLLFLFMNDEHTLLAWALWTVKTM